MTQKQPIKLQGFGPDKTLTDLINGVIRSDKLRFGYSLIIGGKCYEIVSSTRYDFALWDCDEMETVAGANSKAGILLEILKLADYYNEIL